MVRHEEELELGTYEATVGKVRAEKRVEVDHVAQEFSLESERAQVGRVAAVEGDSGEVETLPDGSVSIPVFEEELVITKRIVVRERIVIRKELATRTELVEADLRREHVDVSVEEAK